MKYQLLPGMKPKWIDFSDGKDFVPGIYELKGETLKIVIDETGNHGRPTRITSEPGSPNDLLMIFKQVPMKGRKGQPLPDLKESEPKITSVLWGAVKLQFDQPIKFYLESPAIEVNKKPLHILNAGKPTFHLSKKYHLTAKLNAMVSQYTKVDYWIHAAAFDKTGQLLGTASHKESVDYVRISVVPAIIREIKLDFGVSKAYQRAAYVVFSISDPGVPHPPGAIPKSKK